MSEQDAEETRRAAVYEVQEVLQTHHSLAWRSLLPDMRAGSEQTEACAAWCGAIGASRGGDLRAAVDQRPSWGFQVKEVNRLFEDDDRGDIELGREHVFPLFVALILLGQGYKPPRDEASRQRRMQRTDCWWCGVRLTLQLRLRQLWWAPWWRRHAFIWKHCCSEQCYQKVMAMENAIAKRESIDSTWSTAPLLSGGRTRIVGGRR